jgi:hypothetical protein
VSRYDFPAPEPERPRSKIEKVTEMPNTDKPDSNLRGRVIPPQERGRPRLDTAALEKLLEGWMRGDATEQRETFEVLRRSLDEDRPAGYKLFS